MRLTGHDNYFEDFCVGDVYHHTRGRTISEQDNHQFTLASLNTAQGHVNVEYSKSLFIGYPERLVNGGIIMALAVGLTAQDVAENAVADLGMDNIRIHASMFHGDTLYAQSTILELHSSEERDDCGVLKYRIDGFMRLDGQDTKPIFTGERAVLVKRRSAWMEKDELY